MGPLKGIRVVEMSGIGPAPFCGMLLADLGADVIRVDRLVAAALGFDVGTQFDFLNRSKRAIAVDLKAEEGVALVQRGHRGTPRWRQARTSPTARRRTAAR